MKSPVDLWGSNMLNDADMYTLYIFLLYCSILVRYGVTILIA